MTAGSPPKALRIEAGAVWPSIPRPILVPGALLISGSGRIEAVGAAESVPTPDGTPTLRLPDDHMLLPGLVNAHTHLELTTLRGSVAESDFFEWIQQLRRFKAPLGEGEFLESARSGIEECWRVGVTAVADTGDTGAAARALREAGVAGVAYQEVFGPHPEAVGSSLAWLEDRLKALLPLATGRLRVGVSPHAPYSVSERLFTAAAGLARSKNLPVAVHIAESRAEWDLVVRGEGPFARHWRERGIPPIRRARSPVDLLRRAGVTGPDLLAIHCVRLTEADHDELARSGCGVVLCPRSNRRHGHGTPDVRPLLERGVRVGLGTDSLVSVEDTDMLAEAGAAAELPGMSAVEALRLATEGSAECCGLGDQAGVLEPGRPADVIAVRAGERGREAAAAALLRSGGEAVSLTVASGRIRYASDPLAAIIPEAIR